MQAGAPSRPLVLRSRGVVLSELGKGRTRSGQVWIMESNVSKPLMKCRNGLGDVKTVADQARRDQSGGHLYGTWEPVVPMRKENRKWRPHERESTDAEHRGGPPRSSGEGLVMRLERRGWPMSFRSSRQPETGGPR